jgi:hypothetical protein
MISSVSYFVFDTRQQQKSEGRETGFFSVSAAFLPCPNLDE